jgi:hypothetical protein
MCKGRSSYTWEEENGGIKAKKESVGEPGKLTSRESPLQSVEGKITKNTKSSQI